MCGIAGFVELAGNRPRQELGAIGERMVHALHHRGPDDQGLWIDADLGLVLGHARLSIIDLSPAGHQPMVSASERYVLVFNGEIYNHHLLRQRLDGREDCPAWRGHSDSEVLVEAIERWGVEETLKQAVGMFALVVFDRQTRRLVLARDRMGEKPLYYGLMDGVFLFGSELKALKAHPDWSGEVDRNALAAHLKNNYVPSPLSIYQSIRKLPAASWVEIDLSRSSGWRLEDLVASRFWSAQSVAFNATPPTTFRSDEDAIDGLESVIRSSLDGQMHADVPLGAFLSGGVDSSLVVSLMQSQAETQVRTFSIGFDAKEFDEAPLAKRIAKRLGTAHEELYVTEQDALDVVPALATMYDEPFADSSQIPTFLVSKMARQHVTVTLSGDGGDELFSGYSRYGRTEGILEKWSRVPAPVRRMTAAGLRTIPDTLIRGGARIMVPVMGKGGRFSNPLALRDQAASLLMARNGVELYRQMRSHWKRPQDIVLGADVRPPDPLEELVSHWNGESPTEGMMYLDMTSYMSDDILVKVDRASMAVGLESRVPLLDHRVVEFAWSLPMHFKVRDGQRKWLLRELLARRVPREWYEGPKMGFGVPLAEWLRGPLKDWANELLAPERLNQEGYFAAKPIADLWQQHQRGERDWQYYLWDVLMFQAWLEKQ